MIVSSSTAGARSVARISLRNIAAHKIRLLLTVIAVVLGTVFIAGSLMFTASLSNTFDSIVDGQMKNVSAVVTPFKRGVALPTGVSPTEDSTGSTATESTESLTPTSGLSMDTVRKLAARGDVTKVNVGDQVQAVIATADGETIQTGGAPTVLQAFYNGKDSVAGANKLTSGHSPKGRGEVVINDSAAEKHGLQLGDHIKLVTMAGQDTVTIAGIYSSESQMGGYIGLGMDVDPFLSHYVEGHQPRTLYVGSTPNVSDTQLVKRLADEHPELSVRTGAKVSAQISQRINQSLSFVSYFLVAFGLVGLLVGTFIIANTFSMIVAQRLREFALLRALGVSRRQLTSSVIFEATIVGIIGSALGILGGVGFVRGIYAILEATGAGLPVGGISLTAQSVVVPLILGVIVAVISAWAPARRAGRVEPVEVMRSGDSTSSTSLKGRTLAGVVALILGAAFAMTAVMMDSWETKPRAIFVSVSAVLVLLGAFSASPVISQGVVSAIGRIIGLPFGTVGVLARKNSQRNPRRTATTAFALTLGLALVAVIGMLGSSTKASVTSVVETSVKADYIAQAPMEAGFPVPTDAVNDIADTQGVGSYLVMGTSTITIEGKGSNPGVPAVTYLSGDPNQAIDLQIVDGTTSFADNGFIADAEFAQEQGWTVGKSYQVSFGNREISGEKAKLLGTYEPNPAIGTYALNEATVVQAMANGQDGIPARRALAVMVNADGSSAADLDGFKERLIETTKDYVVV